MFSDLFSAQIRRFLATAMGPALIPLSALLGLQIQATSMI